MNARTKVIDAAKVICREAGIHFSSETATKILDVLESERKQQDIATRYACAEACLNMNEPLDSSDCPRAAHDICLKVDAL